MANAIPLPDQDLEGRVASQVTGLPLSQIAVAAISTGQSDEFQCVSTPDVPELCFRPDPDGTPNSWQVCRKVHGLTVCAKVTIRCHSDGPCTIEAILGLDKVTCTITPHKPGVYKVSCQTTVAFVFEGDSTTFYYFFMQCGSKPCVCLEERLDPSLFGPPLFYCVDLAPFLDGPVVPTILPLVPGYMETFGEGDP